MDDYNFTDYFENEVLRKRPYLKKEWCIQVINNPLKVEPQQHNRSQCISRQEVKAVKLNYYPETDSLYIDLSEKTSIESKEISEGVVLD